MSTEPRFRFAPTPSRELHVGNALAALFGWAMARAARGRFVLRIEDIDRARCKPVYEEAIYRDLAWLGLDWDEGPDIGGPSEPYRQSERLGSYDDLMRRLGDAQLSYVCVCSRADIRSAQSAPHDPPSEDLQAVGAEARELPYPGTCRGEGYHLPTDRGGLRLDLEALTASAGIAPIVEWHDGLLGPQVEDVRTTSGDVLLGRPGQPTYQLAVVADDIAMHITDVVRGVDLIGSTARQIALHRALGADSRGQCNSVEPPAHEPPRFLHHPLLLDGDDRKLSKRDAAIAIASFTDAHALVADLGRAIGVFGPTITRATAADWVDALPRAMHLTSARWPPTTAS